MKEQLYAAAIAALPLLAAYIASLLRRLVAQRLYASHVDMIRVRSLAVAADLKRNVDAAKDPTKPGGWTDEMAATVRAMAVIRVRRLEPLACKVILEALSGDQTALDDLIGTHVEEAVCQLRTSTRKPE